nr:immunoglobulin light chain junction region [Macaca mulatta]MOW45244.1 immunoglobulin light chain junction region [Macaca mulatta]
CLQTYAYPFTL